MRKIIIVLLFYCSIVLLLKISVERVWAIVDGPITPEPPYAPNQLIIKYKKGSSPEDLQALISQRQEKRKNILGFLVLFWQDFAFKFRKEETPERQLDRLENADSQVGAIEKEKLFQSEEASLGNFYLIKTNGRMTVEEAVKLYQAQAEVEFAEPNYIYSIMGI